MNIIAFIGLLASMVYITVAAAVPQHADMPLGPAKRTESTFAWKKYFVHNCSTPTLYANDGGDKISGGDCIGLVDFQSGNNGGYYELWDFDHFNNFTYKPIVGFGTCMLAVSHAASDKPNDYAVVGSADVMALMAAVLAKFQVAGSIPTISGSFVCGPNHAPLDLLVYNGSSGWSGKPQSANGIANFTMNAPPETGFQGPDYGSGHYTTGSAPAQP
ncbi:hypothetical protein Daus18300_014129 [Diaporthe australafricana]|uniref:Ecp2 effector protein-like domain-containing protein n=1 Tax=Diaporthe australafricana TaxID=127596 RepID=A0ABR3VWD4_9PEZI